MTSQITIKNNTNKNNTKKIKNINSDTNEKKNKKKCNNIEKECSICCEKYNNSTRKLLQCPYCIFKVCSKCARNFLLTIREEPHCMSCKNAWSRDFWMDTFPKTFINNDLKKHRQNVLFNREKSLLPATLPIAERMREGIKLKETIKILDEKIIIAQQNLWNFNNPNFDDDAYEKKKELTLAVAEAMFERDFQNIKINKLLNKNIVNKQYEQIKQFVRACPADNCKGMLSTQWKCGLCGIFVCNECHEIIGMKKDIPHICKSENIATAKLLSNDTKPCPKCSSLIFRISGCDQIFCTQCQHAFDWKTGKSIDYARLHNPHFFEWRATHNEAPVNADAPCGGLPSQYVLQTKFRSLKINKCVEIDVCQRLLSSIYHNHEIEMTKYVPHDLLKRNENFRIKLLLNEINEEKFKQHIFYNEKVEAKNMEIYRVMELFDTVSKDFLIRFNNATDAQQILNIHNELKELQIYVNDQMKIIEKRYGHKTPKLDEFFRWCRYNIF